MRLSALNLFLFVTIWSVLPLALIAQEVLVKGVIFDKTNSQRVANALIRNLASKSISQSGGLGLFQIEANVGDTLSISKSGFTEILLLVSSQKDLIVQLQPVIQLSEITIKGQTKKQEMEEVRKQYRSKGSFYNGKPPLLSFIFTPLTALYELFGKTPGQARRFNQYYHNELEQSEIDRRFNSHLVKQLTNFEGKDLQNFMNMYRPEYDKLSKWDDYSLINYIKRSSKAFESLGRPNIVSVLPSLPKAPDLSDKFKKY